jgi:hypothetical protein
LQHCIETKIVFKINKITIFWSTHIRNHWVLLYIANISQLKQYHFNGFKYFYSFVVRLCVYVVTSQLQTLMK